MNGGAYSNYQTIFVHGTNAETELPDADVEKVTDYGWGHVTRLYSTGEFTTKNCWIQAPMPSFEKITGGVQPMVRYLGLLYSTDAYSTGTVGLGIDQIDIYNGNTKIKKIDFDPPLKTGGAYTVKVIDLGTYTKFDRGLNMAIHVDSDYSSQITEFRIGGYGARFEW